MSVRLVPRSIRGKAVLGSGLAIALFGALIGVAAYVIVTQSATTSVLAAIDARVSEVVDQLTEQASADPGRVDLEALQGVDPTYVQVVTGTGEVVAASPGLAPGVALCPSPLPSSSQQDRLSVGPQGTSGDYLRVVVPVPSGDGTSAVCAIGTEEPVRRAQDAVLVALLVALPLLVLAVCVVVWLAVGRALQAVEDMRAQADAMQSTADGLLRVPDSGDEVEDLGSTLNGLLGRLHQQTRATRQFVADAGHELRNPLSTLRVTLEFGQDGDEEELRESVRDALGDLDRLEALTQDLLVLARSDAQDEPRGMERLDFAEIVTDVVAASRRGYPDKAFDVQAEESIVQGDRTALRSMVTNLLDNAGRHAATSVTTTVRAEGEAVVLSVDDDGEGVAADDVARVFERFVRLDEARDRDEGGSGLGLAIVASVAETHGGSVRALAGPGGHFEVTLPRAAAGPG